MLTTEMHTDKCYTAREIVAAIFLEWIFIAWFGLSLRINLLSAFYFLDDFEFSMGSGLFHWFTEAFLSLCKLCSGSGSLLRCHIVIIGSFLAVSFE